MSATGEARLRHIPALDGLRGLAVAVVVVFHLGHLTGGYLGVDLFFTLSGFLITGLLVAEWRRRAGIDLGAFWVRRIRRLLPALLVVLAAVALATNTWGSTVDHTRTRGDGLAALVYVANWREVLAGTDYWGLTARPSPLQHMWSLAIEEQFYLVWPLLVVAVMGLTRRRTTSPGGGPGDVHRPLGALLVVTVALAVASAATALALYDGPEDANRVYYGTDTRAFAILVGAALAVVLAHRGPVADARLRRVVDGAGLVALGGLAVMWATLPGTSPALYSGLLPVAGLAATAVIAAATLERPGLVAAGLSLVPLRALGAISYGLYLWHWPVITLLTPGRTGILGLRLTFLRLALSLALAVASYLLVERPIRQGALHGRPGRVVAPIAMAGVALLVVWSTMGAMPSAGQRGGGRNHLRIAETPIRPLDAGWERMLLVGDSGAWAIGPTLIDTGRGRDLQVVNRGTPACGVARADGRSRYPNGSIVDDPPGCTDWPTRWGGYVEEMAPDLVLLLQVAPGSTERFVEGEWRGECDPAYGRFHQRELEEAVAVLGAAGARVALTTVLYPDSVSDPDGRHPETDCRNATIRRAARSTGATLLDLFAWACEEGGTCDRTVETLDGDDVELRPDGLHFTDAGARVLERRMLDQLDHPA